MTLQREENKECLDMELQHKNIVDLDKIIIENWVQEMWNKTANQDNVKYRWKDLDVKLNWSRVKFWQSEVRFTRSDQLCSPKSQILFKTSFSNNTDHPQEYSLHAERSTITTLNFTFICGFTKEKESSVKFKLPNAVLEVGGGLRHEQHVNYGKDFTYETKMTWSANSTISVAPYSKVKAQLCVTEDEYAGDFSVEVYFSGEISAVISTRSNSNDYYKYMEGNLVDIIAKNGKSFKQFNICKETQSVRTVMKGKCVFRYGIEQHVNVEQEKLANLLLTRTNRSLSIATF